MGESRTKKRLSKFIESFGKKLDWKSASEYFPERHEEEHNNNVVVSPREKCSIGRSCLLLWFYFSNIVAALERAGLSTYHVQDSLPFQTIPALKLATYEIEVALKILCESHQLSLAQVWIANDSEKHAPCSSSLEVTQTKQKKLAVKLSGYCTDSLDDHPPMPHINLYYETCNVLPLKMREVSIVGKTLETNQPHFCRNLNKLMVNGPLGFLLSLCKCSCLAICLRSAHTGDNVDYVFEFLWPRGSFEVLKLEQGMVKEEDDHKQQHQDAMEKIEEEFMLDPETYTLEYQAEGSWFKLETDGSMATLSEELKVFVVTELQRQLDQPCKFADGGQYEKSIVAATDTKIGLGQFKLRFNCILLATANLEAVWVIAGSSIGIPYPQPSEELRRGGEVYAGVGATIKKLIYKWWSKGTALMSIAQHRSVSDLRHKWDRSPLRLKVASPSLSPVSQNKFIERHPHKSQVRETTNCYSSSGIFLGGQGPNSLKRKLTDLSEGEDEPYSDPFWNVDDDLLVYIRKRKRVKTYDPDLNELDQFNAIFEIWLDPLGQEKNEIVEWWGQFTPSFQEQE
ncbi:hypothetical protein Tco_1577856 [Tanacetum coccineum]